MNLKKDFSEKEKKYILEKFKSIESFKSFYLAGRLYGKDLALANKYLRNTIDIDSNPNYKAYDKLVQAIVEPDDGIIHLYSSKEIEEILSKLDANQENIIRNFFGLNGNQPRKTIAEMAKDFNIPQNRVIKEKRQILGKIRWPYDISIFLRKIWSIDEFTKKYLTEEDSAKIMSIYKKISDSDLIYKSISLNDIDDTSFFNDIQFLKNANKECEEKYRLEKQKRKEEANKYLKSLNLSHYAYSRLTELGIITIEDFKNISLDDLFQIINIDKSEIEDITKKLSERGIVLERKKAEQGQFENMTLTEPLQLSDRTFKAIFKDGIRTIDDLKNTTIESLLKSTRGLGKKGVDEIVQKLEERGIVLEYRKPEPVRVKREEIPTLIESLHLSARACNQLRRAGIETIDELTNKSIDEISKIRNLGKVCVDEIIMKLEERGLFFVEEHGKFEKKSELEIAKEQKEQLQKHILELEEKLKEAKNLLSSYDELLKNDDQQQNK